jgi:hypothetical protein
MAESLLSSSGWSPGNPEANLVACPAVLLVRHLIVIPFASVLLTLGGSPFA